MLLSYRLSLTLLLGYEVGSISEIENRDVEDVVDDADVNIFNMKTAHEEDYPLITVMETRPHTLSIMIKANDYKPDTMIRLLYERVPFHHRPHMQNLDDPVIEYFPLIRRMQSHDLTELPRGKYIVCGEALLHGEVYQTSCFETRIERLDNNSEFRVEIIFNFRFLFLGLQSGVKVLVVLSIVIVGLVSIYSVVYHVWNKCKWRQ